MSKEIEDFVKKETRRLEDEGYYTYLMLHILEANHLFDTEACDERWEIAKHHYAHWRNSSWDDENESHYCCFDKYARWFVSHWKAKLPLSKIPTNDNS